MKVKAQNNSGMLKVKTLQCFPNTFCDLRREKKRLSSKKVTYQNITNPSNKAFRKRGAPVRR